MIRVRRQGQRVAAPFPLCKQEIPGSIRLAPLGEAKTGARTTGQAHPCSTNQANLMPLGATLFRDSVNLPAAGMTPTM
jgi:hypothetical protein